MDKILWKVPVYTQSTANLCWEACARMLWAWRFKQLNDYKATAGSYATLNRGLTENEMDIFYKLLGLRSLSGPAGKNLRFALTWSPVIVDSIDKETNAGHALVLIGFDGHNYTVINPCAIQQIDFDKESSVCVSPSTKPQAPAQVEKSLGRFMWYW